MQTRPDLIFTRFVAPVALIALTACGGGKGGPTGTEGSIALTITPATVTILQGATALLSASVTRAGGFDGDVSISVQGAPSGSTGSASNLQTSGSTTTASVAIAVGAATATGTYTITVRAQGSGVSDAVVTIALTVAPASGGGTYTLTSSPNALSIAQGANAATQIVIARTNFAGSVFLAVTNAPSGITGAFSPNNTTGNSSTLTLSVGAAVAAGTYTVNYGGVATGVADKLGAVLVTVTAPGGGGGGGGGSGSASVSFAACGATSKAIWFAYQDGAGAWTQVLGNGDVYNFTINSAKGGYAWVSQGSPTAYQVQTSFATRSELTTTPIINCGTSGHTLTGTLSGAAATDHVTVSAGGAGTAVNGALTAFTINNAPNGTHDLVGWRRNPAIPGSTERGFLKRDITTDGSTVGLVDFASASSFGAATGTLTVGAGSGTITHGLSYYTGNSCDQNSLYQGAVGTALSFPMYGVPANVQRANDFHSAFVTSIDGAFTRTVIEVFHTMASRTITLGAVLATPAVTSLGGNYKRLGATFTIPAEYNGPSSLAYYELSGLRYFVVGGSAAWMGGNTAALSAPNFSGVAGWNDSWAPASAAAVNWAVGVNGTTAIGAAICVEGVRVLGAYTSGAM